MSKESKLLIKPIEQIPMGKATMALFNLEEEVSKGNIPIEVLQQVLETAYNQSWKDDNLKQ